MPTLTALAPFVMLHELPDVRTLSQQGVPQQQGKDTKNVRGEQNPSNP
jgi:hypothetical protein